MKNNSTNQQGAKTTKGEPQSSKKQKVYTKFQYKDQVFMVGDVCRFYNEQRDLIGKILQIASTDQNHKDFGKLKVQWYYYKSDLNFKKLGISEKDQAQICDQELFPTTHTDLVYVQSLNGKCNIVTLDEFEQLKAANNDTFFTRADFDIHRKILKPSFDKWPKICSCQRPTNPQQFYICCDYCENWYHPECQNSTAVGDNFKCDQCTMGD
eukprot:403368140